MGVIAEKKSVVCNDPRDYTMMIYGLPGVGKSTLCASIPDSYFMAFEAGHKSLSVYKSPVDKPAFETWDEFRDVALAFMNNKHSFRTIIFDTITSAYEMAAQWICTKNKVDSLADLGYGKGWKMARDALNKPLIALQKAGYGLVFICHEEIKSTFITGDERTIFQPDWGGNQCKRIIYPMVDMIGYMYVAKGQVGTEMKDVHYMTFTPEPHLVAKDRSGRLLGVNHLVEPKDAGWSVIEEHFNRQETEQ